MNKTAQLFFDIGEPFAAGFLEEPDASVAKKFCRAYRRFYENAPLGYYEKGELLYPSKILQREGLAVSPQYSRQYVVHWSALEEKSLEAAKIFRQFDQEHGPFLDVDGIEEVSRYVAAIDGWNHSVLNFKRITAEGIDRYEERIHAMKDEDLKEALLDVLSGIRNYHSRAVAYLESVDADEKLIAALKKVPFRPAETAYEALVGVNFLLAFDEYDNIGYVDAWLPKYWQGEDLTEVMHSMMKNLQSAGGWSITIGPEYSDLTKQWLRASKGLARPMVELRTTMDMPDDIWDVALQRVLSGDGNPSFYNEKAIQERLAERLSEAPKEDIYAFAGMGCTETSFSGMTFSGGIDVNLNVLKVLEDCMRQELSSCENFASFYDVFLGRLHTAQDRLMKYVNAYYKKRAEISFAPIRTLFTDDCIEKEQGYFQGGARYTIAIPSDSGIPNTVDSLLAIQELVYNKKLYSSEDFLSALDKQEPRFVSQLKSCPVYGMGNAEADDLMHDLTSKFYSYYRKGNFEMGCGFFPSSSQYERHVSEGKTVGPTPDGRKGGQAVADSIAAMNGKAKNGPTVMLRSAARYAQKEVYGIPVLNLTITQKFDPAVLRSLIEGYFEMNGTQMQITCTNREALLDAQKNPENHRDLIVRISGYSAYFCDLHSELQDTIIARTMFDA